MNPPRKISGSGAYNVKDIKSALKPILKEALSNGGAALGGLSGMPGGSVFGRELGKKLSRVIGSGDYQTNTSVNELIRPPGGLASSSFGDDAHMIRLRRREFLTDVIGPATPGTFTNVVYSLNAGLRNTFPFLSQLAANYEEYCFDGLIFEFISSASPYIANTALGTVIASMQYNADTPPFTSKYTMENSANAISTRLDKNLMYGVECAKGSNPQNCYYVRSGTSSLPVTTTDLGKFEIAVAPSSTVPASTVLGELWVTYDVCLKRPRLDPSRYGLYHLYGTNCAIATPAIADGSVSLETNHGVASFTRASGTSITFTNAHVGDQWSMMYRAYGNTVAAGVPTVNLLDYGSSTGIAVATVLNGDGSSLLAGGRNAVTYLTGVTEIMVYTTFQITASSGTIAFYTTSTNWPTGTVTRTEIIFSSLGSLAPEEW